MTRKVEWAKKEFLIEKRLPTKHQLKTKAAVRNKTAKESKKIQQSIEAALQDLRKALEFQ